MPLNRRRMAARARRIARAAAKTAKRAAIGLCAAVAAYLAAACALTLVPCGGGGGAGAEGRKAKVYFRSNGVHVDVVMPVEAFGVDWREAAPPRDARDAARAAAMPYVSFGWGARAFFLEVPEWSDVTPGAVFRAVLGLGGSVLHVDREREPREGERCRAVELAEGEYRALAEFVAGSAKRGEGGRFAPTGEDARYCGTDSFYEGEGRYSPFGTCNSWANRALGACGRRRCAWTPFAWGVMRSCAEGGGKGEKRENR